MLANNSSTLVPALVPALSGYLSNATTTPGSTAPTTPTSETSGIYFRHTLGGAKGKISGLKTSLTKFKTSAKSLMNKTNKRFKKFEAGSAASIVTVEVRDVERVSVMEMAARFQDISDSYTLDIQEHVGQIYSSTSQTSLISSYNRSFPPSLVSEQGLCLDNTDRGSSCCKDLVVISETAELSVMVTALLRCLAIWWPSILSCIAVCLAVFTAYGIYWASTVPLICLIHPASPVWSGLAFIYADRGEPIHPSQ